MLTLYAHPFSSYCWKVLIPLWENGVPFTYATLEEPANNAVLGKLSPSGKFPILVDGETMVAEASIIIEYLQLHHPGPVTLIPTDPVAALDVRLLDRLSDNYLMAGLQAIVDDRIRPEEERDPVRVAGLREKLVKALAWWDAHIAKQVSAGRAYAWDDFSLADCAAFPALFYIDWIEPFAERFPALHAYRARLMERPSIRRAVDEARPYRHYFPFGAPDRD